jgi:hypothetical protein
MVSASETFFFLKRIGILLAAAATFSGFGVANQHRTVRRLLESPALGHDERVLECTCRPVFRRLLDPRYHFGDRSAYLPFRTDRRLYSLMHADGFVSGLQSVHVISELCRCRSLSRIRSDFMTTDRCVKGAKRGTNGPNWELFIVIRVIICDECTVSERVTKKSGMERRRNIRLDMFE